MKSQRKHNFKAHLFYLGSIKGPMKSLGPFKISLGQLMDLSVDAENLWLSRRKERRAYALKFTELVSYIGCSQTVSCEVEINPRPGRFPNSRGQFPRVSARGSDGFLQRPFLLCWLAGSLAWRLPRQFSTSCRAPKAADSQLLDSLLLFCRTYFEATWAVLFLSAL